MEETIYVTFSAKYYLYQKQIFDRQVATAQEWIDSKDPESIKKVLMILDVLLKQLRLLKMEKSLMKKVIL